MTRSGDARTTVARCAYCGNVIDGHGLCAHHSAAYADDWAKENRLMCNLIHRGIAIATPEDQVVLEAA
jgi:hypothetical protein